MGWARCWKGTRLLDMYDEVTIFNQPPVRIDTDQLSEIGV